MALRVQGRGWGTAGGSFHATALPLPPSASGPGRHSTRPANVPGTRHTPGLALCQSLGPDKVPPQGHRGPGTPRAPQPMKSHLNPRG